jgi:hypothetical protein
MRCVLEERLLALRAKEIVRTLKPLLPTHLTLACRPRRYNELMVLAPYSGPEPSGSGLEGHKFATKLGKIRAAYHERWQPTDFQRTSFALERAYLHLYLRDDQRNESEIVALHCDPNERKAGRHYRYKAGPHIHMKTAGDPLAHSHIGLHPGEVESILSSADALTKALATGIEMLADQVLGLEWA